MVWGFTTLASTHACTHTHRNTRARARTHSHSHSLTQSLTRARALCGNDLKVIGQDGFIHLTEDPALLLVIANNFFMHSEGDWLCLEIDPAKLTAEVL